MNNARRKALTTINERIAEFRGVLEELKDAEQEYYDNMPESFQTGDKGQKAETAVDAIDSAIQSIEEAAGYLDEAVAA
jgi:uncharacterized coiled-coil DUF342 family protein